MSSYLIAPASAEDIISLKSQYLSQVTAPLDGMWQAFESMANHYKISHIDQMVGYCTVNDEQKLLEFFTVAGHDAREIFHQILTQTKIIGAFVATCDAPSLSLCLDHQNSVSVNALMYHVDEDTHVPSAIFEEGTDFTLLNKSDLETAIIFTSETLGAEPDWLRGYYKNLIAEDMLHGLWQAGKLIAVGECRPSATQKLYADLGMIVSQKHRKQGLATNILRHLIHLCNEQGLKPICSTEASNIDAQKAISNAGFTSYHRILEVTFSN